jgi:hypothetical protein
LPKINLKGKHLPHRLSKSALLPARRERDDALPIEDRELSEIPEPLREQIADILFHENQFRFGLRVRVQFLDEVREAVCNDPVSRTSLTELIDGRVSRIEQ